VFSISLPILSPCANLIHTEPHQDSQTEQRKRKGGAESPVAKRTKPNNEDMSDNEYDEEIGDDDNVTGTIFCFVFLFVFYYYLKNNKEETLLRSRCTKFPF
jgi:hypothetical protein